VTEETEEGVLAHASDPPEIEGQLWDGVGGGTGWDVGANVGNATALMTDRFRQVIAFEPCDASYRQLALAWGDHPGVTHRCVALADTDGTLEVSERAGPLRSGQVVMVRDMPEQTQGLPASQALPWGPELRRRHVPCQKADTLASIYGVPDFIKVDTEGHEARILHGAAGILGEGKTSWLIEFHFLDTFTACSELLSSAGYRCRVIRHPHYPLGSRMWYGHGWLKATPAGRDTRNGQDRPAVG
jgi:FkbM family methyltransferase